MNSGLKNQSSISKNTFDYEEREKKGVNNFSLQYEKDESKDVFPTFLENNRSLKIIVGENKVSEPKRRKSKKSNS